jgi:hypothetical protein
MAGTAELPSFHSRTDVGAQPCTINLIPKQTVIWRAMRFMAVQATENIIRIRRRRRGICRIRSFLISIIVNT